MLRASRPAAYPGDTGDFSNSLYVGYRLFNTGNFGQRPAGNTDIAPTLLSVLGLPWQAAGSPGGRVLRESLRAAGAARTPLPAVERCIAMSAPTADGRRTLLFYQRVADSLYLDEADYRAPQPHERSGCLPMR